MFSELRTFLTLRRLQQLAGSQSFERGETYHAEGRVGPLVVRGQVLTATVHGNEPYKVRLEAADDRHK